MVLGEIQGKRIGELLVSDGLISAKKLEQALHYQKLHGGRLVQALIALGYVSLDEFINFLSRQPGIASIDLARYQVPRDILELLPRDFVLEHEVFPIDRLGKLLTLGMLCPIDRKTIEEVQERTGLRVKPLLCSPKDIRHAIQQYYGIHNVILTSTTDEEQLKMNAVLSAAETSDQPSSPEPPPVAEPSEPVGAALKLEQVVQLIRRLDSLPALPETVHRVREAMDDLSITPKQVSEVICKDPPIAAKVLSVANSAAYGFPNRVDSVDLAVALLGLRETYSIVLSSAIMNLFETHKIFDYTKYWEEAVGCAASAKIMASAFGFEKEKSIYTAALLHSIGRIALLETVPELYTHISSDLDEDELEAEEMRVLGLTNAEAGYELSMQWGIPEAISIPIRFQRHPEYCERHREVTALVGLAVHWTRTLAREGNRKKCLKASAPLLEILDVDSDLAGATFDTLFGMKRTRFQWDAQAHAAAST